VLCVVTEVGDAYGDVRPLTTELEKVLRTNYARLVELINTKTSGLVSKLTTAGVITGEHRCPRNFVVLSSGCGSDFSSVNQSGSMTSNIMTG